MTEFEPLSRRDAARLLGGGIAASLIPGGALAAIAGKPDAFSWTLLQEMARRAATRPFRAQTPASGADAVDFDAMGALVYRPEATLPGGIRLFPASRIAPHPVRIYMVEGGIAREVTFTPSMFSGPAQALGIAGFRAVTPSGTSDWMAFLGASYFRTAGSQDQYGLSARGVAVDTGLAQEEFPEFTQFWIEPTGPQACTVYALLDGPSISGAYRFVSRLTQEGVVQDVTCSLYPRRDIARLGIAPSTSMYWYGEGGNGGDWRPEIHDSDGLALWTGAGERIWRPLENPKTPRTNRFADRNPKGFGLMQRDRRFASYQDDGAFYEKRANLWVEPQGDWGAGAVLLYAFPTSSETLDNVVSFWESDRKVRAGARLNYAYRLNWTSRDLSAGSGAIATDSWRGAAGIPGAPPLAGAEKRVVDFHGATLAGLDRNSGVSAQIDIAHGKLLASAAYPVVGQPNRWRVTMDVTPEQPKAADIRLFLKRGGAALTETVLLQVT